MGRDAHVPLTFKVLKGSRVTEADLAPEEGDEELYSKPSWREEMLQGGADSDSGSDETDSDDDDE